MSRAFMSERAEEEVKRVGQLVALAGADTVFGDLYLARARHFLAPLLSELDYERLHDAPVQIERALGDLQSAAARRDWIRVKQLATYVTGLRQGLQGRGALLDLGAAVFGAQGVSLDPFSRLAHANGDAVVLRDRLVRDLEQLVRTDAEWRDFYAARLRCFSNLYVSGSEEHATTASSHPDQLEQAALAAAERGEVERLGALVDALLAAPADHRPMAGGPVTEGGGRRVDSDAGVVPFTAAAAARGREVGLRAVCLRRYQRIAAVLRDGARRGLSPGGVDGDWLGRAGLPLPFRDVLGVLGRQQVVTSSGTPYVPVLRMEHVLLEDFAEAEDRGEGSALLEALRLSRRWGVARAEIEQSLGRLGPSVVEDLLALDPCEYRLVCVPFDVYVRAGARLGWGRQAQWTHLDGYQVLRNGTLRALVGGDVRYGGIYDLCSIDHADDRDGVVVRLAVVQRTRFQVV